MAFWSLSRPKSEVEDRNLRLSGVPAVYLEDRTTYWLQIGAMTAAVAQGTNKADPVKLTETVGHLYSYCQSQKSSAGTKLHGCPRQHMGSNKMRQGCHQRHGRPEHISDLTRSYRVIRTT